MPLLGYEPRFLHARVLRTQAGEQYPAVKWDIRGLPQHHVAFIVFKKIVLEFLCVHVRYLSSSYAPRLYYFEYRPADKCAITMRLNKFATGTLGYARPSSSNTVSIAFGSAVSLGFSFWANSLI